MIQGLNHPAYCAVYDSGSCTCGFSTPHEDVGRTEYVVRLEQEVQRLRAALTAIVDADAHLNCVCGRNKLRMSGEKRNAALVALGREPWSL